MNNKVLFVDDEPNVLDGIRRQLRKDFDVLTAVGGAEGLAVMEREAPIGLVVSDMRMPEMDGVQFLAKTRQIDENTTRMVLSGQADLRSSIEAVNQGAIFRFLTKPIDNDALATAVASGLRQYQLVTAERELLDGTLRGTIRLLTDILAHVNPTAAARGVRIQGYAQRILSALDLEALWDLEIAAMLSQIGCLTISEEILGQAMRLERLDEDQQRIFDSHPALACEMLNRIPRLEAVAAMVSLQSARIDAPTPSEDLSDWDHQALGAQILHSATEFDTLVYAGKGKDEALRIMRNADPGHPEFVLDALDAMEVERPTHVIREVDASELRTGMILREPLYSTGGVLLLAEGHDITENGLLRLRHYAKQCGLRTPISVVVTATEENAHEPESANSQVPVPAG